MALSKHSIRYLGHVVLSKLGHFLKSPESVGILKRYVKEVDFSQYFSKLFSI